MNQFIGPDRWSDHANQTHRAISLRVLPGFQPAVFRDKQHGCFRPGQTQQVGQHLVQDLVCSDHDMLVEFEF